jgi:hypothetical protein
MQNFGLVVLFFGPLDAKYPRARQVLYGCVPKGRPDYTGDLRINLIEQEEMDL